MNNALSGEITRALLDLALAAVVAVLGWATTWLETHRKLTKTVHALEQSTAAKNVVNSVVAAVQQLATTQGWSDTEKKTRAVTLATKILNSKGLDVTDQELNVLVESAVHALKNSFGSFLSSSAVIDAEPDPAAPISAPPSDGPAMSLR